MAWCSIVRVVSVTLRSLCSIIISSYVDYSYLCATVSLIAINFATNRTNSVHFSDYVNLRLLRVSVSQRRWDVYADIQPYLYDAVNRTLERLSPVSYSDASRLSVQHLGRH